MAILSQLFTEEELKRLSVEDQRLILTFVTAGGAVAEGLDDARVPAGEVENPRAIRKVGPMLKEVLANVRGLEEAKRELFKKY